MFVFKKKLQRILTQPYYIYKQINNNFWSPSFKDIYIYIYMYAQNLTSFILSSKVFSEMRWVGVIAMEPSLGLQVGYFLVQLFEVVKITNLPKFDFEIIIPNNLSAVEQKAWQTIFLKSK